MCSFFERFFRPRHSKAKEKERKRANALILLNAIHEIDDEYVIESLLTTGLMSRYAEKWSCSEKESIERIKELTYKKIQALENQK